MSTLNMHYPHTLELTAARSAISRLVDRLAGQMPMQTNWADNVLHFSGAGMEGEIDVREHEVTIHATLGILASAMKGLIEMKIIDALRGEFGESGTPH